MREAFKGAAVEPPRAPPLEPAQKLFEKSFRDFQKLLAAQNIRFAQGKHKTHPKSFGASVKSFGQASPKACGFQKLLTIFFDFSTSLSKNFSTFQQPFLWMKENKLWKSLGIEDRKILWKCRIKKAVLFLPQRHPPLVLPLFHSFKSLQSRTASALARF